MFVQTSVDTVRVKKSELESVGPFLKWAGGKGQLLREIIPRLPSKIQGRYVEPFVGGGAVFFELVRLGRIRNAILCDTNSELITTYQNLRDDVDAVIKALSKHRNEEDYFYKIRAQDPASLKPAVRAARMIFLNRVGYNGLYRVNSLGQFNVPYGHSSNPTICNAKLLRAVSLALQNVDLRVADFEQICLELQPHDVVYFDPPYVPVSPTANFINYNATPFRKQEHQRLAKVFKKLVHRQVNTLLSNSDTPLVRRLYSPFKISEVYARRAINSRSDRRGPVCELLVEGIHADPCDE